MTANFSKAKKKTSRFGTPPAMEEASTNLKQPEHAPEKPTPIKKKAVKKSNRTVPFGFRVSSEFLKDFKTTALKYDLNQVELLEASLESFKNSKNR